MNTPIRSSLQIRSLVKAAGELELSLVATPLPAPGPDEVVLRIDAAPINPSDLGLLLGAAEFSSPRVGGTPESPVVTAPIAPGAMRAMAGRVGESMAVGNEGAGVVVEAGASAAAQALLGKTVAVLGGSMYSEYRTVHVEQCLVLPQGITAEEGASAFVNPLTSLGMVGTMRAEGHTALVHTAAASNLGQMLNRLCIQDGVSLVNIVRKPAQAELLRAQGAKHVISTDSSTFMQELTEALITTGATLAFDAIGGGPLAGQILSCMETAANKSAKVYSRYGSTTHKQVYLYGSLDFGPTVLNRSFGMAWGIGGWLVTPFLAKTGPAAVKALKDRVAAEIKTTFASRYTKQVSLLEALQPATIAAYNQRSTGQKFLITPHKR